MGSVKQLSGRVTYTVLVYLYTIYPWSLKKVRSLDIRNDEDDAGSDSDSISVFVFVFVSPYIYIYMYIDIIPVPRLFLLFQFYTDSRICRCPTVHTHIYINYCANFGTPLSSSLNHPPFTLCLSFFPHIHTYAQTYAWRYTYTLYPPICRTLNKL